MENLHVLSESSEPFQDRSEAGELLADALRQYCGADAVAVAIPRGGIIIANEIANRLDMELDILLAHKLGAPANPELAIGAICENGTIFINEQITSFAHVANQYIEEEKQRQKRRFKQQSELYRRHLPRTDLTGRIAIITDDGVATGATVQASLWAARRENPYKLILALPVGPPDTVERLARDADETICLRTPPDFGALSKFYLSFPQVEDETVIDILQQHQQRRHVRR